MENKNVPNHQPVNHVHVFFLHYKPSSFWFTNPFEETPNDEPTIMGIETTAPCQVTSAGAPPVVTWFVPPTNL